MRSTLGLLIVALALLLAATPSHAQSCDPTTQTCLDQQDYGDGGGGGWSGGCQYCFITLYAPYANCFSAPGQYPQQKFANCYGTRICPEPGNPALCRPACTGSPCYSV